MKHVWIVQDKEFGQIYIFSGKKKAQVFLNNFDAQENIISMYKSQIR